MRSSAVICIAGALLAFPLVALPASAQSDDQPYSGLYAGATVGYDFQGNDVGEKFDFDRDLNGTFGDTVTTASGADAFSPGFCDGRAQGVTRSSGGGCENDRSRISYSGRIGYDRQFGNIVVGVVGEVGKTNIRDYVSAFSIEPADYILTTKVNYNASLRGRVGYAANRTLFYATGGGAYARLGQRFETSNTTNSFSTSGKRDAWGYTAGGGLEQKITKHVSFNVEYLFNDVKADRYIVHAGAGTAGPTNQFVLGNANGTDMTRVDRRLRWQSIRADLKFRF